MHAQSSIAGVSAPRHAEEKVLSCRRCTYDKTILNLLHDIVQLCDLKGGLKGEERLASFAVPTVRTALNEYVHVNIFEQWLNIYHPYLKTAALDNHRVVCNDGKSKKDKIYAMLVTRAHVGKGEKEAIVCIRVVWDIASGENGVHACAPAGKRHRKMEFITLKEDMRSEQKCVICVDDDGWHFDDKYK
jgi:hypothetical protein